jgi:hypothetical protein
MCQRIRQFGQAEYSRVLDYHGARTRSIGHAECAAILKAHGASAEQAKNGAYVYLHHGDRTVATKSGSRDEYTRLLNSFGASTKRPMDCIRFLERLGFSVGQAKTAVYNYRSERGLIGR